MFLISQLQVDEWSQKWVISCDYLMLLCLCMGLGRENVPFINLLNTTKIYSLKRFYQNGPLWTKTEKLQNQKNYVFILSLKSESISLIFFSSPSQASCHSRCLSSTAKGSFQMPIPFVRLHDPQPQPKIAQLRPGIV